MVAVVTNMNATKCVEAKEPTVHVIRVLVRVQPDMVDDFTAHIDREAFEVPARFAGCERYALFNDPADPVQFLLYEEWRDGEAFAAYRGSDHFAAAGAKLRPMLDGPPDSAYFQAELVGP
jgi:quinol monooxygenase YgiN